MEYDLAQCEKEGGYLAEVGTAAENQWLFQTFVAATFSEEDCPKYYSCAIWIGGNDLKQEGHFVWSHNNNTIPLTNGLWLTGRPNDFKKEQDCLAITHSSGLWNDLSCSTERPFICEFEF
ncbi:collectin-11-like [Ostrea edulis]|uniref:collectin-11-like n=1 Tax=Ostrea edulis TaxID=37623 RepID=UPI0024AFF0C1|nr:collectin-11-like [Ostrea edulis]